MAHERDHDDLRATTIARQASITPGKSTSSARLMPRPIIYRVASADDAAAHARDGNGVAAGAEPVVQRAAASTGAALPADVRGRFESSLGADLSSVRVHTGAASADAASAVGARAYTTGQDIHFGAGQYAPQDPFGLHLLAHEVAHTVQQSSGAATTQYKLEVSTPGDAAEVEADRAADAMVSGAPAAVTGAPAAAARTIMRDEVKAPVPPPPPSPFDPSNLKLEARQAVDTLTVEALRTLALAQIARCYSNFQAACAQVKLKLDAAKKKREDDEKKMFDLALGALGLVLGPVGAAAGAQVAALGPAAQSALKDKIASGLPGVLTKLYAADPEAAKMMTNEAYGLIASDAVTKVATKLTPESAAGVVGSAASAAAKAIAHIDLNGGDEDRAIAYVDALLQSGDEHDRALGTAVGTCIDPGALLGVYNQFNGYSLAQYKVDIEQKAQDFLTQISSVVGPKHRNSLVVMNAYGRERLANVRYISDSANYLFVSWVTPDMEPIARQLNPNPLQISPGMCSNHVPNPEVEGAVYGQDVVVRMDAWGKPRLAIVKADQGFFVTNYGQMHFVRWISPDEAEEYTIRGNMQNGGIRSVAASSVAEGVPQPPAAWDAPKTTP